MRPTVDDQNQITYKTLTGDGTIIARVTSQTNTNVNAKAGVIFKDSARSGSNYAATLTYPSGNMRFHYNYNTSVHGGTLSFPNVWVKLTRAGNTFTSSSSPDGITWTQIGSGTITMSANALVGLFVSSLNPSTLSTATFDHVSVTQSPSAAVYSIHNFHGDTALTVGANGLPSSSVFLYDPFGQVLSSNTFGTDAANLTNASDNPMGWAASPLRKAERYHRAVWVFLDIKPKNWYILDQQNIERDDNPKPDRKNRPTKGKATNRRLHGHLVA